VDPGAELFVDPSDDSILGPGAGVVLWDAVDEEEDGGEALDVVLLSEVGVLGGVDLGKGEVVLVVVGGEVGSGGGIVRGERLAVAAPGGVELDHDVAVGGEEGGEVEGGEDDDVGLVDLVLSLRLVEEIVAVFVVVREALFLEPLVGIVGGNIADVVGEVLEVLQLFILAVAGGGGNGGGGSEEEEKGDGERSRGGHRHGREIQARAEKCLERESPLFFSLLSVVSSHVRLHSAGACGVPTAAGGEQSVSKRAKGPSMAQKKTKSTQ
jgi:hypothetical protein